ncbi:hypothetical protein KBD81_03010, partial [Candidatus Woesebacteria bacterium]|nr:hypothetical protein [Candidatus Woesebacteria bacterium]
MELTNAERIKMTAANQAMLKSNFDIMRSDEAGLYDTFAVEQLGIIGKEINTFADLSQVLAARLSSWMSVDEGGEGEHNSKVEVHMAAKGLHIQIVHDSPGEHFAIAGASILATVSNGFAISFGVNQADSTVALLGHEEYYNSDLSPWASRLVLGEMTNISELGISHMSRVKMEGTGELEELTITHSGHAEVTHCHAKKVRVEECEFVNIEEAGGTEFEIGNAAVQVASITGGSIALDKGASVSVDTWTVPENIDWVDWVLSGASFTNGPDEAAVLEIQKAVGQLHVKALGYGTIVVHQADTVTVAPSTIQDFQSATGPTYIHGTKPLVGGNDQISICQAQQQQLAFGVHDPIPGFPSEIYWARGQYPPSDPQVPHVIRAVTSELSSEQHVFLMDGSPIFATTKGMLEAGTVATEMLRNISQARRRIVEGRQENF